MRPTFQADADLNHKIVLGIRRREPSIDFLSASQGLVIGKPDFEVLALACDANRILVSHDRATMPRHFQKFCAVRCSPGLLIVPQDLDIGASIEDLLLVWLLTEAKEWENRIGFLPL